VPWKPDWSQHTTDARFAPYEERVALLLRDGVECGLLLVQVPPNARRAGGHLWWRRWEYGDGLLVVAKVDGHREEALVHHDLVEGELRDYRRNLFRHHGEVLHLQWMGPEDSERLRRSELGSE